MPKFDSFAESLARLLPAELQLAVLGCEIPGLDGGPEDHELQDQLKQSKKLDWGNATARATDLAESGLWLLSGDLDRSHSISQSIDNSTGSFWHGIMHRREGDYGNAKYWFRRAGNHPALQDVFSNSAGDYLDPFDFVDACESAQRRKRGDAERCKVAQWIEWQALMLHSLRSH